MQANNYLPTSGTDHSFQKKSPVVTHQVSSKCVSVIQAVTHMPIMTSSQKLPSNTCWSFRPGMLGIVYNQYFMVVSQVVCAIMLIITCMVCLPGDIFTCPGSLSAKSQKYKFWQAAMQASPILVHNGRQVSEHTKPFHYKCRLVHQPA